MTVALAARSTKRWSAATLVAAVAAVTFTAGCGQTTHRAPTKQTVQPIVDGQPATAEEFYGTVALTTDGMPFCTGTLIAPTVVVTAAHCLFDDSGPMSASDILVVAGALDPTDESMGSDHGVAKAVGHSAYDSAAPPGDLGKDDDIALLVLDSEVTTVDVIPVMAMSDFDSNVTQGTDVIITGYGIRDLDTGAAGSLHIAESPFQERTDTEYSAGAEGTPDSCSGDSGGPGYVEVGGEAYLIGASSRSLEIGPPDCGLGGINTLVPAYDSWLVDNADGAYAAATSSSSSSAANGATSGGSTGGATTDEDSSCSYAPTPNDSDAPAWLFGCVAGLTLLRRRRRS